MPSNRLRSLAITFSSASILKKEKLNGSNFLDWYRNLRIVIRNEQKLHHLEEALFEAPPATATAIVRNAYSRRELKTIFQQHAEQELFETVKAFHTCKQEEGQSVSTYKRVPKKALVVLAIRVKEEQSQYIWYIRGYRKLNEGALDLYVGNGSTAAIEAIGSFDLILPSRMILVLDNCHFPPSITRGVISLSHLWDNGFFHKFMDNGAILVSKDNKRIEKLQHDGILESIDDESFDVCVSCISGKMARKPFTHASEKADDLLGIIHSDIYGPFRTTSREGDFDEIQRQDAQPSENTSQHQHEVEHDVVDPQTDVVPVHRSARIPQAPERYGFMNPKNPKRACKLQRSIYRHKQASRSWNKRFDEEIKKGEANKRNTYASAVGESYWTAVKNILKYLRNTKDIFLVLVTGYVFVMNEGVVDWKISKQSTTIMSSMEAEYIVVAEAAMEAIWIRKFIYGLGVILSIDEPMDMYCDNTSTITITDETGVQKGAKHFQRKYHFICEVIQEGDIRILKVHTDNNLADPLTKPMPCVKHVEHVKSIRLRPAGSFM
uniref:Uncharacterized protein n=1 Tax=Tanacetum cinerariifolium TaxID=118510 RepID=A0A6L2N4W9_TANCI|nr:hypothetical protein [Tanacetum cinerariifolium]